MPWPMGKLQVDFHEGVDDISTSKQFSYRDVEKFNELI